VEQISDTSVASAAVRIIIGEIAREVCCTLDTKDDETAEGDDSSDDSQNSDDIEENEQVGADVGPNTDLSGTKMILHSADITGSEGQGILGNRTPFIQAVSVDPTH